MGNWGFTEQQTNTKLLVFFIANSTYRVLQKAVYPCFISAITYNA